MPCRYTAVGIAPPACTLLIRNRVQCISIVGAVLGGSSSPVDHGGYAYIKCVKFSLMSWISISLEISGLLRTGTQNGNQESSSPDANGNAVSAYSEQVASFSEELRRIQERIMEAVEATNAGVESVLAGMENVQQGTADSALKVVCLLSRCGFVSMAIKYQLWHT